MSRPKLTPDEGARAIEMFNSGVYQIEIAGRLNVAVLSLMYSI